MIPPEFQLLLLLRLPRVTLVCVCMGVCVRMHALCAYLCMYACMCLCAYVCPCVCVHLCVCVSVSLMCVYE